MRIVDIITKKRDGGELTRSEIDTFIRGYVAGDVPDYQAAAFCMAVYFRGMTPQETAHLTEAMAFSGATLDLHAMAPPTGKGDVAPFIVDKHSSGGVGDKTTLVVGPMVASLGVPVGKMSGRGLSFSGGTLDKLESIPGFDVNLTIDQFKRQLREIGLVVAGQTQELAPADGKLYALRDVTGTVPALPLIASSIMSKKLAAGADAIVLDVKAGHGAFMETVDEAVALAELMVEIGARLGRKMSALIGDMSQPLGLAVGNALEVVEAIETLHGRGPADFRQHCIDVAAEMLLVAAEHVPGTSEVPGTSDIETAKARAAATLTDGAAWAKFRQFVAAQGGDLAAVDDPGRLPRAPLIEPLSAPVSGYVARLDAREVGYAVVELGGGRAKKDDAVDPAVGVVLSEWSKIGSYVEAGEPLLWVHAATPEALAAATSRLAQAYTFSDTPVPAPPVIHWVIR
jgi:pyrimidine-nucleoside phosphorylase